MTNNEIDEWLPAHSVFVTVGTSTDVRPHLSVTIRDVVISALRDPEIRQALREALKDE